MVHSSARSGLIEAPDLGSSQLSHYTFKKAKNKGDHQTAQMRRLIYTFLVRIKPNMIRIKSVEFISP